jgi:transcriptional regulator GlxA family with amidase domain
VAKKTISTGIAPRQRPRRRRPHVVGIVVFDGVVLGDVASPLEVFSRARGERGCFYEVRVCSASRNVESTNITLGAPWRLETLEQADTIVVPGIGDLNRRIPEAVLRALRRAAARGARLASMCTGAFILAASGVLDGLRATTHWRAAAELARRFPKVDVDPSVLYVDNGLVLTSAGAAAALDLCLHIVRRDFGATVAAEVARAAVMPLERDGGQAQFIVHSPPADAGRLQSLLQWIDRNFAEELSLARLARRAGMSTRTLSRQFRDEVGSTPAKWVAETRVRRAQSLLETTKFPVERIATEVGFQSAAVFREHFRTEVGTSPLAYRRAFVRR